VQTIENVQYELPYTYITENTITWAWMATHGRKVDFRFLEDEHKVEITTKVKPLRYI